MKRFELGIKVFVEIIISLNTFSSLMQKEQIGWGKMTIFVFTQILYYYFFFLNFGEIFLLKNCCWIVWVSVSIVWYEFIKIC